MPPNDALSIMLEPAGWERSCGRCEAVFTACESEVCGKCGGPLSEKRVSDYRWECPECLETGFEPRGYGATVKCKACRGIFEVGGVKVEKPKKEKAAKEPRRKKELDPLTKAVAAAKEEKPEKPAQAPGVEKAKDKKRGKKKEWLANQISMGF
jgi:hypothetical protein